MPRSKKIASEGCETDMTPMIDVVFQLIIFFIVTIKLDQDKKDIELEMAKDGPEIKGEATMVVEIDQHGWISMHGAQLTKRKFFDVMKARYGRQGEFPVLIRADRRTKHEDVKTVMDICAGIGIWKVSFAAIKKRAE
jgi:biopolymer transport protein ExbD